MRISDWSSDVCSSDLSGTQAAARHPRVPNRSPALEETRAMANVTYTARPYIPGQMLGELVGRFVMATCALAGALRDAYAVERKAQKLAQATRHLDRRLLRDIGLDHSRSEEHTSELQSLMR